MSKKKELPKKQVFSFTCGWKASIQGNEVRLYSPRMLDRKGQGLKIRLIDGITWETAAEELKKFNKQFICWWTSVRVGNKNGIYVSSENTSKEIHKFANALSKLKKPKHFST